jgi:hypothetical protein
MARMHQPHYEVISRQDQAQIYEEPRRYLVRYLAISDLGAALRLQRTTRLLGSVAAGLANGPKIEHLNTAQRAPIAEFNGFIEYSPR